MPENEIDLENLVASLADELAAQIKVTKDLLDYLERTDENFQFSEHDLSTWRCRLESMRNEDLKQAEINKAKKLLEHNSYIVVKNGYEMDAAKLKAWTTIKERQK